MQTSVIRFLRRLPVAAVVTCSLVAGCHHGGGEPIPRAVEQAPYRLSSNGWLEVSEAILPKLTFSPATKSSLIAELHGVGEVDFSPGALTAMRVPFDGIVESVDVTAGETVSAGKLLARIRSSELARMRADIQRIESTLVGQRDALKRSRELVQADAISNRRIIELESSIGALEAEKSGMSIALRAAQAPPEGEDVFDLVARRDGEVIRRNIDPGEQVRDPENEPAFVIADPTALMVRGDFPERDSPFLRVGAECILEIPALGEERFYGRLRSVVRSVDPGSRTVEATCDFTKVDPRLQAHMLARIIAQVEGDPVVVVPRDAVLLRRDARVVLIRKDGRFLERRQVKVGPNIGPNIAILFGVQEGEEVVSEGAVLLDGELDKLL